MKLTAHQKMRDKPCLRCYRPGGNVYVINLSVEDLRLEVAQSLCMKCLTKRLLEIKQLLEMPDRVFHLIKDDDSEEEE